MFGLLSEPCSIADQTNCVIHRILESVETRDIWGDMPGLSNVVFKEC